MTLRHSIIRLAHAKPELREHLLPLVKASFYASLHSAQDERGSGGLIFNFERGFSVRTKPTDPPYNQTYDGLILLDKAKKPYTAALKVVQAHRSEIERLKTLWAVSQFIDEKVKALVGKTPGWHQYSMPD
jgi:hypothetical protein